MKLVKALGALALLVVLLVGVPVLLAQWGQLDALTSFSFPGDLLRPDDGRFFLGLATALGWAAWGYLGLTTLAELARKVSRGKIDWRLPGGSMVRPLVAVLIATAMAPLVPAAASTADLAPAPQQIETAFSSLDSAPKLAHQPEIGSQSASAEPAGKIRAPEVGVSYVVQPGDELWTLAETHLGSGAKWREITELNPGIGPSTRLTVGDEIRLPSPALPAAGSDGEGGLVVEPGDTLWDLAGQHLSDTTRWPELASANAELISDPDHIEVGWELIIPDEELPTQSSDPTSDSLPSETKPSPGLPTSPTDTSTSEAEPTKTASPDSRTQDQPAIPGNTDGETVTTPESSSEAPSNENDTAEDASPEPVGTSQPAQPISPQPSPSASATPAVTSAGAVEDGDGYLVPVSGLLAAGIFAGVAARRRLQLLQRAVGRRLVPLGEDVLRFWGSVSQRAATGTAPEGRQPTTIVLGWDDTGREVEHALEPSRHTVLHGEDVSCLGLTAAAITSLACADWSTDVELVLVESVDDWESAFDDPRVTQLQDTDDGLRGLKRLCAERRIAQREQSLAEVRSDPDIAAAWQPVVFIFLAPLAESQLAEVQSAIDLGEVGVSALSISDSEPGLRGLTPVRITHEVGQLGQTTFEPQLLSQPARRALLELFTATSDQTSTPAPWWEELPTNVVTLPQHDVETLPELAVNPMNTDAPKLLLLGAVELTGCHGTPPTKAAGACMEYCAWLLENPGASAAQMGRELLIAEGTRRSNMSRLRAWLGQDDQGNAYLPEAYSGEIRLTDEVTSDWDAFQMLLAGGVNYASSVVLTEALKLVRGVPLADVSFQWVWAETMRADMIAMITDAACVLADRSLERGNLEQASWAIAQGRLAHPDSEVLAVREIRKLAQAGSRVELDQAVMRLTRAARNSGRDLSHDSIRQIQQSLHLCLSTQAADGPQHP